jgi:hypothetical protein
VLSIIAYSLSASSARRRKIRSPSRWLTRGSHGYLTTRSRIHSPFPDLRSHPFVSQTEPLPICGFCNLTSDLLRFQNELDVGRFQGALFAAARGHRSPSLVTGSVPRPCSTIQALTSASCLKRTGCPSVKLTAQISPDRSRCRGALPRIDDVVPAICSASRRRGTTCRPNRNLPWPLAHARRRGAVRDLG